MGSGLASLGIRLLNAGIPCIPGNIICLLLLGGAGSVVSYFAAAFITLGTYLVNLLYSTFFGLQLTSLSQVASLKDSCCYHALKSLYTSLCNRYNLQQ